MDLRNAIRGRVLYPGEAEGPLLKLAAPISLWGGVDPSSGRVIDPRHPDHATDLSGSILVVPGTVGSSSSSAIMLELLRQRTAPAALLVVRPDAIAVLGVIVAHELGHRTIPVIEISRPDYDGLPTRGHARVASSGTVDILE